MANTVFSKNLRKLREEKRISQKSAAANLGISQALLSHYEKGIRECGHDFLVRAAKFYEVSSDYLLGISGNRGGMCGDMSFYHADKSGSSDDEFRKNGREFNIHSALYKNLLINAVRYVFDGMKGAGYKEISVLSGKYISLSVYCLYTLLYGVNSEDSFEKILISQLKCIINLKKGGSNEQPPLGKYNFENPYLNNIINGIDI